jgi:hypothetical protein
MAACAATPRARRCGGRTARWPASTCPRWLAEHGLVNPPAERGHHGNRSLSALRAPEYQYLFELGRKYRALVEQQRP